MVFELAERTKATNVAVKYLDGWEDYETRAKDDILYLIKYPEVQNANFPLRILSIGIRPFMYFVGGSIVNLHPSLDYDKLKYASMGLVHVGLSEAVLAFKNWLKIRNNKKVIELISEVGDENRLILVGGLVNRWFGSSYS